MAFHPTGKEIAIDPEMSPTVALVRRAELRPTDNGALTDAKLFGELYRAVQHGQQAGRSDDHLVR
jgi:hypothetical protein